MGGAWEVHKFIAALSTEERTLEATAGKHDLNACCCLRTEVMNEKPSMTLGLFFVMQRM